MIVKMLFENDFEAWRSIDVKIGDKVEYKILKSFDKGVKSVEITDINEIVYFYKRNVWEDGIQELIFSVDGIFYNAFSSERLPCSFEFEIYPDSESLEINVMNEANIVSDSKSQSRWKLAVFIQLLIMEMEIIFVTVILVLAFKKIWHYFVITAAIIGIIIGIAVTKKKKKVLNWLNRRIR